MSQIIDGKKFAKELLTDLKGRIASFKIKPGLAIFLLGNDPASEIYVANKIRMAKEIGIETFYHHYPHGKSQAEIISEIKACNKNNNINGILVQLPLPQEFDQFTVINSIDAAKDVDGLTIENIGLLNSWENCLEPSTPQGILLLLKNVLGPDLSGKKVVILGRSMIVGRPMASILIRENCSVTLFHSKSHDIERECKSADILISAIGKPGFITAKHVKPGACVIDVGITRVNDKIRGDVDFEDVKNIASHITPVPGGVGPMTVACMLLNTVKSMCMQNDIKF